MDAYMGSLIESHALDVYIGNIDPSCKLGSGEYEMKPLLVKWVTQWANDDRLSRWIISSWKTVTKLSLIPMVEPLLEPDEEELFIPGDEQLEEKDEDDKGSDYESSVGREESVQLELDSQMARKMSLNLRHHR